LVAMNRWNILFVTSDEMEKQRTATLGIWYLFRATSWLQIMFSTKERHALYTSREEKRENEQNIDRCNVTQH